jgi:acyl dehydratase
LKFDEFKPDQIYKSHICIDESEFKQYVSFAKVENILHQKPDLAKKEGINGTLLPGRAVLARAEGEMTQLEEFSDNIMLFYGMDGDPQWDNRQTRFLAQAYVGDEHEVEYTISDKREENTGRYGILSIDIQVKRVRDNKLIIVSRRNLYRIKK